MVVVNNPVSLHPQYKMGVLLNYQQYSTQTGNKLSQASTTPKSWSQHVEKELDHTALGVGVAGVAATGPISCWVWLVLVVCC